jgi:hypothetical protein
MMHNEVAAVLTTLGTHLIAEEPNYVATTTTYSTTAHDWSGVGNGATKGQSYVTQNGAVDADMDSAGTGAGQHVAYYW